MNRQGGRPLVPMTVAIWLCALGIGAYAMDRYARQPGPIGVIARPDPSAARVSARLYLHPRCPCSRATLEQLTQLLASLGIPTHGIAADVEILMYRPEAEPDAWAHGPSWTIASRIPGARVLTDPDAQLATADGAITSGHIVIRDASGQVTFAGGITPGRGQSGPSAGADRVLALLREPPGTPSGQQPDTAPVFGCRIADVCGPLAAEGSEP